MTNLKTRITLLVSPETAQHLAVKAARAGISRSKLVSWMAQWIDGEELVYASEWEERIMSVRMPRDQGIYFTPSTSSATDESLELQRLHNAKSPYAKKGLT